MEEKEFLQDLASIAGTNIDSVLKYDKNEIILRNIKSLYDERMHFNNCIMHPYGMCLTVCALVIHIGLS